MLNISIFVTCVQKIIICVFQYKLCRVRKVGVASKGVPMITTHDGRTIRYPDPLVKVNDSVMVDIASGKMKEFIKFDSGETILSKIMVVPLC